MNNLSRTTALKAAAVLSFLVNAAGVAISLPMIIQGATTINSRQDMPPYGVMLLGLIIGGMAMIAAFGVWRGQRWAIILTIVLNLVGGLSAAPGILFAPTSALLVSAIFGVVLSIVIIVLCLWRDPKPAAV